MLVCKIRRDQREHLGIQLNGRDVHGRHPELVREGLGEILFGEQASRDEAKAEACPRVELLLEALLQLLHSDETFIDEELAETPLRG